MTASPTVPAGNNAVIPVPKLEPDFYDWDTRHATKCRAAAAGNHDLVFIGDSLTHLFEGDPNVPNRGERLWAAYYGGRRALNLGFGWDRTQNVLWRLAHGEFTGQTPRLVVLLIGTNNLTGTANARTNTPAEIAAGVQAICAQVLAASPASQLLLLGVFPRSTPADPLRGQIRELNVSLQRYAAGQPAIVFADTGARFLAANGTIAPAIMNDGVHLTEPGYQLWAEAIEPVVQDVVGTR